MLPNSSPEDQAAEPVAGPEPATTPEPATGPDPDAAEQPQADGPLTDLFEDSETQAYTQQPVPSQPMQVGAPGFEGFPSGQPFGAPETPKKKRTGIIVGAAIGAVALIAAAILVPMGVNQGGGHSLTQQLELFPVEDEFVVALLDNQGLFASAGDSKPPTGAAAQERFQEICGVLGDCAPGLGIANDLIVEAGGVVLFKGSAGLVSALPGTTRTRTLDGSFGKSVDGVWRADAQYASLSDGTAYFSSTTAQLPLQRPEAQDSLAADEDITRLARRLERIPGYQYELRRVTDPALAPPDFPGTNPPRAYGTVRSIENDLAVQTTVLDHGTADAAASYFKHYESKLVNSYLTGTNKSLEAEAELEGQFIVLTTTNTDPLELTR